MFNEDLLFAIWREIFGSGGYTPSSAQDEAKLVYEAMKKAV